MNASAIPVSQKVYTHSWPLEHKLIALAATILFIVGTVLAVLGMLKYFGPSFSDGYTLATTGGGLASALGLAILIVLAVQKCQTERPAQSVLNQTHLVKN